MLYGLASVADYASRSFCFYFTQRNLYHLCALLPVGHVPANDLDPTLCIILPDLVFPLVLQLIESNTFVLSYIS